MLVGLVPPSSAMLGMAFRAIGDAVGPLRIDAKRVTGIAMPCVALPGWLVASIISPITRPSESSTGEPLSDRT
ncbi:hypothetical protein XH83_36655 (plasmid) [Bradyrhizobium sp. CCBAU 53351]|uniref:Uncharacterized protein n=2 Tax=Bradyrhizobium TaxID=374 RepID=A0AAE5X9P3_9BRAD|nr:hypothetical protein X265_39355 [Bradyrhizobium guangdongense]QAU51153.1 hypothetical protein XH91_38555 [Bradyrhizobium guangzhouense]QOZ49261.1 hypothetical protein XH89_37705 [Bradyrhizobium sp. CCBAU 53340]QOZ57067.1 hypothetical protein XH90_38145 [Bradyrhizobium sp. CCBAU 53338]QOZ81022.1 hypothetical protein XH83_36655 [Bradyrhizobium sp. CCBAU 53351]